MIFFVFHVSFFKLNLHTVSEPNVLFRNHTRTGKTFMTIFPLMKLCNSTKPQWARSFVRIDHNVNKASVERVKRNHPILSAIVKSIEFGGTYGLAVPG